MVSIGRLASNAANLIGFFQLSLFQGWPSFLENRGSSPCFPIWESARNAAIVEGTESCLDSPSLSFPIVSVRVRISKFEHFRFATAPGRKGSWQSALRNGSISLSALPSSAIRCSLSKYSSRRRSAPLTGFRASCQAALVPGAPGANTRCSAARSGTMSRFIVEAALAFVLRAPCLDLVINAGASSRRFRQEER